VQIKTELISRLWPSIKASVVVQYSLQAYTPEADHKTIHVYMGDYE